MNRECPSQSRLTKPGWDRVTGTFSPSSISVGLWKERQPWSSLIWQRCRGLTTLTTRAQKQSHWAQFLSDVSRSDKTYIQMPLMRDTKFTTVNILLDSIMEQQQHFKTSLLQLYNENSKHPHPLGGYSSTIHFFLLVRTSHDGTWQSARTRATSCE